LLDSAQIMTWSEPYFDFKVTRFRAFEPAGTDLFTPDELSLVDCWLKQQEASRLGLK